MPRPRALAAAALAALALAGCSSEPPPSTLPAAPSSSTPAVPPTTVATAVVDQVPVYDSAEATTPVATLDRRTTISGGLVLLVTERRPDRLQVLLPTAPAGSTGWVAADAVTLTADPYAVQVSLGRHELTVTREGEPVLTTPAGTGTTDRLVAGTPYYVTELLRPPDPAGPYGPYAYALSGGTTTPAAFAAGSGVLAISGTSTPAGIGTDVATGCVVVANDVVTRLAEQVGLPLGTPVTVVP